MARHMMCHTKWDASRCAVAMGLEVNRAHLFFLSMQVLDFLTYSEDGTHLFLLFIFYLFIFFFYPLPDTLCAVGTKFYSAHNT